MCFCLFPQSVRLLRPGSNVWCGLHRRMKMTLYFCGLCAYTSSKSSHVNRHLKTHTGARPYSCEVCGKSFTRKESLVYHSKSLHPALFQQWQFCSFSVLNRFSRLELSVVCWSAIELQFWADKFCDLAEAIDEINERWSPRSGELEHSGTCALLTRCYKFVYMRVSLGGILSDGIKCLISESSTEHVTYFLPQIILGSWLIFFVKRQRAVWTSMLSDRLLWS